MTSGAALALVLEFGQTFVSGRIASRSDVLAACVGGVIGVGLWLGAGQRAVDRLRRRS